MLSETDLQTASMVLAKCAAYDPWFPKPDGEQAQATIQAWATTFKGIEPRWVLAGVDRWYASHGAKERVLPADIVNEGAAIRQDFRMRMSMEQSDVYAEETLQRLIMAKRRGKPRPEQPLPLPSVLLPDDPDNSPLSDEQRAEWERLKATKRALRAAEDEVYAVEGRS